MIEQRPTRREVLPYNEIRPNTKPLCPEFWTLNAKRVTPHVLRHSSAMLLRAKEVDIATIALWLGHESTQTTHIYEHADPELKEKAIARTAPLGVKPGRYHASDTLIAFLETL
jgi:integrase/recombinase XerD